MFVELPGYLFCRLFLKVSKLVILFTDSGSFCAAGSVYKRAFLTLAGFKKFSSGDEKSGY